MHTIDDLELLARFWSVIFGKALNPSIPLGPRQDLSMQRLSFLDTHSEEIQQALRGLARLQQLADNPNRLWAAEALYYAHIQCGSELRRSGNVYLTLGLGKKKRPARLSEEKRNTLITKGLRLYDKARFIYLGTSTRE